MIDTDGGDITLTDENHMSYLLLFYIIHPCQDHLAFYLNIFYYWFSFANGKMAVISRNYLAKCKNLKTKSFDLPCFFLITPWKLPAYNVALLWDKYLLLKLFHIQKSLFQPYTILRELIKLYFLRNYQKIYSQLNLLNSLTIS